MSDNLGFNKAARNQAAREKKAKEEAPPPLQPSFPFKSIPFDYDFFAIKADPQGLRKVAEIDK